MAQKYESRISRMANTKINDKKDIVEYVENVLGLKLLDYQKIFLRKVYEAYTNDGNTFINMPRKCGILRYMELFREYKEHEEKQR